MRVVGVQTLEEANEYRNNEYRVWWEREMTVEPANADDAHRPLEKSHNLASSLRDVEQRPVRSDYRQRGDGKLYQIDRRGVTPGLRGANIRVEQRLDGTLAVRHGERYWPVEECIVAEKVKATPAMKASKTPRAKSRGSDWNKNFNLQKGPKIWQAAQESGCRKGGAIG